MTLTMTVNLKQGNIKWSSDRGLEASIDSWKLKKPQYEFVPYIRFKDVGDEVVLLGHPWFVKFYINYCPFNYYTLFFVLLQKSSNVIPPVHKLTSVSVMIFICFSDQHESKNSSICR